MFKVLVSNLFSPKLHTLLIMLILAVVHHLEEGHHPADGHVHPVGGDTIAPVQARPDEMDTANSTCGLLVE